MQIREKCVYCGKTIEEGSREHIIYNALGGLYESENICCDKCNNTVVSQKIDVPFTKTFNPVIGRIEYFTKTNNTKSKPSYTGKARFGNEIYNVIIKNGKVVSCQELSKKMKCKASKLDFEILEYDFKFEEDSYNNGIGKIAFNFALDNDNIKSKKHLQFHTTCGKMKKCDMQNTNFSLLFRDGKGRRPEGGARNYESV